MLTEEWLLERVAHIEDVALAEHAYTRSDENGKNRSVHGKSVACSQYNRVVMSDGVIMKK